jgi:uncharacterized HAD superfamily protein
MVINSKPIAIDIDGVLADLYSPIFKELGLSLTSEDVRSWNFFDELGVSRNAFWTVYKELWSNKYTTIPLVEEDAPATIAKLRQRYEVHILSSRPRETYSGTMLWLKYKGIECDGIHLLPPKADKTRFLHNFQILVDDNPEFARDTRVILFDRPWNQGVKAKRRIRSLRELLEIVPALTPPQRGV